MKTTLATIAASTLVLVGCGDGGSDGASDGGGTPSAQDVKVAKAISGSLMEGETDYLIFSKRGADCIGEGMVDEIGVDALNGYGFVRKDGTVEEISQLTLSPHDAETMTETMFDCTDVADGDSATARNFASFSRECIRDDDTEDRVMAGFTALFSGEYQAAEQALTPFLECADKVTGA